MRGNDIQVKVHFQGKNEDFVVFVESPEAVQNWKKDSSVPLAQVVDGWKIFVTHKHGNQGVHDAASKGALEDEFGTSREEEVIKQILEKGAIIEKTAKGRDGGKNDSNGPMVAH